MIYLIHSNIKREIKNVKSNKELLFLFLETVNATIKAVEKTEKNKNHLFKFYGAVVAITNAFTEKHRTFEKQNELLKHILKKITFGILIVDSLDQTSEALEFFYDFTIETITDIFTLKTEKEKAKKRAEEQEDE